MRATRVLSAGGLLLLPLLAWQTDYRSKAQVPSDAARQPLRMSFHNRLVLNRAVLRGLKSIQVMVMVRGEAEGLVSLPAAAKPGYEPNLRKVSVLAERLGGRVRRSDDAVGYLRVEVPTDRLLELAAAPGVEAYQISSLARGSWYHDAGPQLSAEVLRGTEMGSGIGSPPEPTALPPLPLAMSREAGFTGDEDTGMAEWIEKHPTFDGRGVTIALLESGLPAFLDPTMRSAKTLDGRDVPKLAGIVNSIDPEDPDTTRVTLDTEGLAESAWTRIGARTYVMPRTGRFRFGLFTVKVEGALIQQFGVLRDETTREVWVDADSNANFREDAPIADVNERLDVRKLKWTYPRKVDADFVIARGRTPHTVHVYAALGSHQAMTVSVAAGSRTDSSLAYGVAPNARVLLVRWSSPTSSFSGIVEGYLEVAARPDVDVLGSSDSFHPLPDMAAEFTGLLLQRLADTYGKPIINSAGNLQLMLNSTHTMTGGFSVGGSLGPRTFAAMYGGRTLDDVIVHPVGAAGPSLDGAIKPDFIAPVTRISADLPGLNSREVFPSSAPAYRLPLGYQISCCTSATSPYATGFAALLISAARQQHVTYTLQTLGRAMRMGARFLPDWPSHQQGNGVLDINGAWRELTRTVDLPRIVTETDVVHPLAAGAVAGPKGVGIFEFDGWSAGMTGRREIRFRRESGPPGPVTYGVSWTGGDGTFTTLPAITLPLEATVSLPVSIAVRTPGAHSAILNLHDPASGAIIFRTQATIVASRPFDASTRSIRIGGTVGFMRHDWHFLQVPADTGAVSIELEVMHGVVGTIIMPAHGLYPNYYYHLYPGIARVFKKGRHHLTLPTPESGTWTIQVKNDSAWFSQGETDKNDLDGPSSTDDAVYSLTVRALRASVRPGQSVKGSLSVNVENLGSTIRDAVLESSVGAARSHRGRFLPSGLPNVVDITVPQGATALSIELSVSEPGSALPELYLVRLQ